MSERGIQESCDVTKAKWESFSALSVQHEVGSWRFETRAAFGRVRFKRVTVNAKAYFTFSEKDPRFRNTHMRLQNCIRQAVSMEGRPDPIKEARGAIRKVINDPVVRMLLENSQVTMTQFQTLLADSLYGSIEADKEQKTHYRPDRARITRGAFNRTLIQAQNNVIRSIYTVLLLGYAGLFDTPALQPFLELSDTIKGFVEESRAPQPVKEQPEAMAVNELRVKLQETISALARRKSFKGIL